jgi:serine/threonine-protein kinase HipA
MAMKLGGKYKFGEVEARHWDRFAIDAGLSAAQTRTRVLEWARILPDMARALWVDPMFNGEALVKEIVGLIEQRAALTIKRLSHA